MKRPSLLCISLVVCASWLHADSPLLRCSDRTFSLPATRYMHKIRTADSSATVDVTDLPGGLQWNSRRKLVEGRIDSVGDYTYTVVVDGKYRVP
ncbi:MAG: hypothetical protein K2K22_01735, partial [Muribaculaceae bacterium]|nr:hypothetical protein [Muribaculaceae bacterium]